MPRREVSSDEQVRDLVIADQLGCAENINVAIGALGWRVGKLFPPVDTDRRVDARVKVFRARLHLLVLPSGVDDVCPIGISLADDAAGLYAASRVERKIGQVVMMASGD